MLGRPFVLLAMLTVMVACPMAHWEDGRAVRDLSEIATLGSNLRLLEPGLLADPELAGDPTHHPELLTVVLLDRLLDHPHRTPLELGRIRLRRWVLLRHLAPSSKIRSLRRNQ